MPLGFGRQWKRGALVSAIGKWRKGNQKNEDIVVDLETLLYEFTGTDPEVWVTPWSEQLPMKQNDLTLFEYACHEGNIGMAGILAGARAEEAAARTEP